MNLSGIRPRRPRDLSTDSVFLVRSFRSPQGGTGMEDTRLYAMLLGIDFPWRISRVQVDMASERIDVWVEEAAGARVSCAGGQEGAPGWDHMAGHVWGALGRLQCR